MTTQTALRHEPELQPHPGTGALVPRTSLLQLLGASSETPVAVIIGPPGHGKTTLIAQWAERDPRTFAWLTIDERDNDPSVLVRDLIIALDRTAPIGRELLPGLDDVDLVVGAVLPHWRSALSISEPPAVLVLDDAHLLQNPGCWEVVSKLIDYIPPGSQLAIAGRGEPLLRLARLRAEGRVLEVGRDDLAMDVTEAAHLLEQRGVDVGRVDVAELVRQTDGWPAALAYLYPSRGTGDRRGTAATRDNRFLADYLWSELTFRHLPRSVVFLTRCSVLERMSGPLCDSVLATTGSAEILDSLSRSSLLVIPLDRRRRWYRLHHLFRTLLRARLERNEPGLAADLTRRAAEWCERNDLAETAVEYAVAAADADRATRTLVGITAPTCVAGRREVLQRWFGWFEANELVERHPDVALLGAWAHTVAGRPAAAERWADAAAEATTGGDTSTGALLALVSAAQCRHGVEQMSIDAELALTLARPGSAGRAWAQLLLGISHLLAGNVVRADRSLAAAAEIGDGTCADCAVLARAERAGLAIARGEWPQAEALVERAEAGGRCGLREHDPSAAMLRVITARLAVHHGDVPRAKSDLAAVAHMRAQLTRALPYLAVQVRLEMTRGLLALSDATAAGSTLREVDDLLLRRPRLGILRDQADELRTRLESIRTHVVGGAPLTAAELRVLRLLETHYSFREIGEQLHVSQHTVKSQAMSIYQKLGVSSRSEAIGQARELSLLVDHLSPHAQRTTSG